VSSQNMPDNKERQFCIKNMV